MLDKCLSGLNHFSFFKRHHKALCELNGEKIAWDSRIGQIYEKDIRKEEISRNHSDVSLSAKFFNLQAQDYIISQTFSTQSGTISSYKRRAFQVSHIPPNLLSSTKSSSDQKRDRVCSF